MSETRIRFCNCGQSIFGDMTECGDCDQSAGLVIGIDPGPEQSAFVCLSNGRVFDRGTVTNEELAKCDGYWSNRQVFIEMIASYGMAVGASVFETCVWIGRFTELSRIAGGKISRVFRRDIKLHLCNSPRAKDGNVRQALIDRLGPQGTKKAPGPTYGVKSHEWAALAVAVYGWDQIFGRQSNNAVPPA